MQLVELPDRGFAGLSALVALGLSHNHFVTLGSAPFADLGTSIP